MNKDNYDIPIIKDDTSDSILYYLFKTYIYEYITGFIFDNEKQEIEDIKKEIVERNIKFTKSLTRLSDIEMVCEHIDSNDFEIISETGNEIDIFIDDITNKVKFDRKHFITIISETYKTDTDIIKQYSLDFLRQTVRINNKILNTTTDFFYELSKYNQKINLDEFPTTYMNLCILFVCQTTFYLSYIQLFEKINKIKENNKKYESYHITYIGEKCDKDHDCINLFFDNDILRGEFYAKYRLINLEDESTICDISSRISFSSDNKDCELSYDIL
jgi:hypothetical protein